MVAFTAAGKIPTSIEQTFRKWASEGQRFGEENEQGGIIYVNFIYTKWLQNFVGQICFGQNGS